ncbi:MAG: methyltransferase [Parcubacteria group bacterium Gr01-1014_66]|nr:MAG: methyltransferase [Parcubacteria group bacterium Gr01-1014_66]
MNKKKITRIKVCRVCGGQNLSPVLSLGKLYVSDFLQNRHTEKKFDKHPLDLVLCSKQSGGCGLVQLRHTVSPELMYRNYWYRSGVNKTMTDELRAIAHLAGQSVGLGKGDTVVDIGCNDGTLLRSYTKKGIRRVGFEPAKNLMIYARKGTDNIINDFFTQESVKKALGNQKAKIITSIAMFYDLENPNTFVATIRNLLDQKGIWIIQMSYLPSMLKQNAFDNICHEHLEYYALGSLEQLLRRHQLEVYDVEENQVNGGSFRIFVRHVGSTIGTGTRSISARVAQMRRKEKRLRLDEKAVYDAFAARVNELRERLRSYIIKEIQRGKTVYGYGASTKGNTLLQFFKLDHTHIRAIADRNPAKWGMRTIGTTIPIISEEQARREKPDYFLVLPWHFLPEFMEREKKFRQRGGKFIVPLPRFRVM